MLNGSWSAGVGHKLMLGMVHLDPLPGTPFFERGGFGSTVGRAVASARALEEGGADGCLVQTVDRVYPVADESDPARTAAMALAVRAVVEATGEDFHVGVQLLRNAVKASLGVAQVAGASFVRVGALVGMTLSPHGVVQADPLGVMQYRRRIGAEDVALIADVDSMHFKWFGGGRPTGRVARDAQLAGAGVVAVSDPDANAALAKVAAVREAAAGLPVVLAGETNHDNAARLLAAADGAFVGGCLERDDRTVDGERVRAYVDIVRGLER